MNLDWLSDLIRNIPEAEAIRKNFIAIAGYPKWENVNSNLLAFYFDEKEEHGFGRLFFDSLLDVYYEKIKLKCDDISQKMIVGRENFDSGYQVKREVYTHEGNRIDLILTEDSLDRKKVNWGIIIENKLDAKLDNDLNDYWLSIDTTNKIGVVLSIRDESQKLAELNDKHEYLHYENILHEELIEKIKLNLHYFYLNSDDRHLLFLKDYISNVKSHCKNQNKMKDLDKVLTLFQDKEENIKKLLKLDKDMLKHVSESMFFLMKKNGLLPESSAYSKDKFFYFDKDGKYKDTYHLLSNFRLWVDLNRLRYCNEFRAVLGFKNKNKENEKYANTLKKYLDDIELTHRVKVDKRDFSVLEITIPIGDFLEKGFESKLVEVVERDLFETTVFKKVADGLENVKASLPNI